MLDLIVFIPDIAFLFTLITIATLSFSVKIFCFCFTVYVDQGSQEPYKTSCSIY